MSSILTNNSAMVALQTLKSINSNLASTQSEISTGKAISSAKDNAAVWAISKVMESDVKGFKGISESLSLGESTVAVAQKASETVTDLLTQMKGKIVAAQEENVDRSKLQTDIAALRDQIGSVVNAAQFNGLNLIDGSSTDTMDVLASLDRDSSGNVTARHIEVGRQNLSVTTPVTSAAFGTTDPASQAAGNALIQAGANNTQIDDTAFDPTSPVATIADGGNLTFTIGSVSEGDSYQVILDDVNVNVAGGGTSLGQRTFEYVAGANDGTADVAQQLVSQISSFFAAATGSAEGYSIAQGTGGNTNQFTITNGAGGAAGNINVGVRAQTGGTPGTTTASGGLGSLQTIDVTNDAGATGALTAIEGLIDQSIDAAAAFGSAQGRIETQSNFISSLSDSLTSGIGALVDADMEATSARLQALQVQQQLGTQALSIANQAPQNILSLFR
ncbi:flagellin [Aliiroseovarius halocynthiae]|uniref:Flagellin n=1 Tax=Aliiroseovarius halocynthiae TaxID=985055 RepID=A0A545SLQ0_9RHOB|nr:flagellin [Aliiroseovarius halocynthiae]TQV65905.1 flagellin [Aliiroseovarius halocynthiae]SMR83463.1 flagellin [Aliiroseovarius halocynthiae]